MKAELAILAGGLGTRMQPRTVATPKFLIEVRGKPFARWLLARVAACGFDRAVLSVGHLAENIRGALGDSCEGVALEYVEDGPELLGTAGALKKAVDRLDDTFLVTYGDSYLPFDYRAPLDDLRAHPEANGTMSVTKNDGRWDASNTIVEGDRAVAYEKGTKDPRFAWIDYGAIALRREAIEALPAGKIGLEAVQSDLAARGVLRALVVSERFYEIGSEAGLADLESMLASRA